MFSLSLLFFYLVPFVVTAVTTISSSEYFAGLTLALNNSNLTSFSRALSAANTLPNGARLVNSLYSNASYTIYAPINSAWESSGLVSPPASDDSFSLLSYHVVTATINSTTDVASPRHHTIAFTRLRNPSILLPGNQSQTVVLETSPNVSAGSQPILIREASVNVTSSGPMTTYQNLFVQPVDDVLQIPSSLLDTLALSGLAVAANLGATAFLNAIASLGLNGSLSSCHGCTFFVPSNAAFAAAGLATLNETSLAAVLGNHVINGSVLYSPRLSDRATFITAVGGTLAYTTNSTGGYVTSAGYTGKILRSDLLVSNGVVHLIDKVLVNQNKNPAAAAAAVSSASAGATGMASDITGTIGTSAISTATAATTSSRSEAYARVEVYWAVEALMLAVSVWTALP